MFVLETINSKMRIGNPNFGSASPLVGRAARARGSQHRRRDATRAPKGESAPESSATRRPPRTTLDTICNAQKFGRKIDWDFKRSSKPHQNFAQ
jgi:hypothetical protein